MQEENEFVNSFLCPITQEIMKNPVIASDGQSYEKKAIEDWFNCGKNTSPVTGGILPNNNLIENYNLKSIINLYLTDPSILINRNQNNNISQLPLPTLSNRKEIIIPNSNYSFDYDKNYSKSKKFRLKGDLKLAYNHLLLSNTDNYIYSHYILYFLLSGIIGNNTIILRVPDLEDKLYNLIQENLYFITIKSEEKDVDALYILGILYLHGVIYEPCNEKAKFFLELGSSLCCPFCMNLYGNLLEKEDDIKCMEYYENSYAVGDLQAKHYIAILYKDGKLVEKNIEKYLDLLEELANDYNNFYDAQFYLGEYYLNEKRNIEKAILNYKKAAENDHIPSMEKLADMYLKGNLVEKNNEQYKYWKHKSLHNLTSGEDAYIEKMERKVNEIKSKELESQETIKELSNNIISLNVEMNKIKKDSGLKRNVNCNCFIF